MFSFCKGIIERKNNAATIDRGVNELGIYLQWTRLKETPGRKWKAFF